MTSMKKMHNNTTHFFPFTESLDSYVIPNRFNDPFNYIPTPLCLLAVEKLQHYLNTTTDLQHNFGLDNADNVLAHGKMFGVLIAENEQKEIGFLMAFSGKLIGENDLSKFVPVVGHKNRDIDYLNSNMTGLTQMNHQIEIIQNQINSLNENHSDEAKVLQGKISTLKLERKQRSQIIQQRIFEEYTFLNALGESKSLLQIFQEASNGLPPSGAGECAAPKLLQYAFESNLKPIAMSEFWWGKPRKSQDKKHGAFYPSCLDKCGPILQHMLKGLTIH